MPPKERGFLLNCMKKFIVLVFFLIGGTCLLSAALYINRSQIEPPEYVEEKIDTLRNPELLSEIKIESYVSLPAAFEDISIKEEKEETSVTENNVEEVMYNQLVATAHHLDSVKDNALLFITYTITKDEEFITSETDYWMNFKMSDKIDDQAYNAIKEAPLNESVRMSDVLFDGYEGVTVDFQITDILDMPYPVTDQYIKKNTEYASVADMQAKLLQYSSSDVKTDAREKTLDSLIDKMVKQTTFISVPDSLAKKELEVIKKEKPSATMEDAQESLYRTLFIAAMIEKNEIASLAERQERFEDLPLDERKKMTEYETERAKYMLFEEEVVTFIYKKIQIS